MTEPTTVGIARPVSHISTLWAWLFVGLLVVAVVVGVIGRVFSTAVVLDIVSFWPFLIVVFLIAATVLPRARGRSLAAVVPLLLIGWLVSSIALHLSGWDQLPSSAARLTGPVHVGAASLAVEVPGLIDLRAVPDQQASYLVTPRRAGGPMGAPEAIERQNDSVLTVALRPTEASRWFQSEGWDVTLDQRLEWALEVSAETVNLDLTTASVRSLVVTGNGSVILSGESAVEVELAGNVSVVIAQDTTVQVIGQADVPARFVPTDDGFRSGEGDPTVVIRVVSGEVAVTQGTS